MYRFRIFTFGFSRVLISVIFTFIFVSVLFFSLFYMSNSNGMGMLGITLGCPFMTDGTSLCPMSTVDHISAWESTFLLVIPSLSLLLLNMTVAIVILVVAPNLLKLERYVKSLPFKYLKERLYTFSYRSLQEFFSDGILHPKLF